jgi:hypothetical protein
MSVDFDVVDALAGFAEDLHSEGDFAMRLHDAVKRLKEERDEARASLQNLLADRGDILLVADSRLDAVLRQRDEATGTLEADLKRTRAMIEHLTAIIRAQDARERQRLVEVATRQREACARRANVAVDSDSLAEYLEGEVLATPLVTEGEK